MHRDTSRLLVLSLPSISGTTDATENVLRGERVLAVQYDGSTTQIGAYRQHLLEVKL